MHKLEELFLLDTHVWVWLANGDMKISSPKFLNLIQQKAEDSCLRISIISIWEIGMLEAKGRIVFPYSCLEWTQRALRAPGLSLVPMTPEIAIESSRLPGDFHGDPVDRIIVATARSLGAVLVTQDSSILAYSKKHSLKTLTI